MIATTALMMLMNGAGIGSREMIQKITPTTKQSIRSEISRLMSIVAS